MTSDGRADAVVDPPREAGRVLGVAARRCSPRPSPDRQRRQPAAGTKTRAALERVSNLPVVLMAGRTPPAWRPMRVKLPASEHGSLADSGTGDRQAAVFRPAVVVVDGGIRPGLAWHWRADFLC
jgi:hypothetical protein